MTTKRERRAGNARAIRAYENSGFVEEGRERESAPLDGEWHDDAITGVLEGQHRGRQALSGRS
ncbi:hypothetical protein SAMN06265365_1186 [Tistlia consotensis]|uniref:Diamine N-acetyltransferase n=1 Tax=Tistlia consotensis USBA 355 TaxID=560819 RepID=A0A1Y6CAE4_9PROT|nr:GNAT family protein [Tistlia consotensis]SMF53201.1 diamine N-acetyltransferase [Tistlia consotensis USBA 355]SNR85220.1 hypothetical protein SAMN06265365_1186 [Tistlia consotensis]